MVSKLFWCSLVCLLPFTIQAQILGGGSSFTMFDLAPSSRLAALGAYNTSLLVDDPMGFIQNPALLSDTTAGLLSAQYNSLYSNISHFNTAYNDRFLGGNAGIHLRVLNYGNFEGTDAGGNSTGNFSPSEYALTGGYASRKGPFSLGLNLKFSGSQIAGYNSHWAGIDMGVVFIHPQKAFTVGLSARNIGFALDKYTTSGRVSAPLDIMLGMSYKLDHAPLRLSITSHNWQQWAITYLDPNKSGKLDANGQEIKDKKSFFDSFARHFVIGGEFLLSKNFQVRLGYNHLMNRELKLNNVVQGAGISYGFMLRVKSLEVTFSRASWSAAGGTNTFGIILDLQKLGYRTGISTKKRDDARS